MTVNTYAINGTALTLQPTTGQWLARGIVGIDGNGRAIYEPTRRFELRWQLSSVVEFDQLQNFFENIGSTGSYTVALPQWGASTYVFYNYSGCLLQEPEIDPYFENYIPSARMLITKIRT